MFNNILINDIHKSTKISFNNIINYLDSTIMNVSINNIIIESHTLYLSYWGEKIAEKYNAKHIIYLLDMPRMNSIHNIL